MDRPRPARRGQDGRAMQSTAGESRRGEAENGVTWNAMATQESLGNALQGSQGLRRDGNAVFAVTVGVLVSSMLTTAIDW